MDVSLSARPLRPDLVPVCEPLDVTDGALPPEGNVKLHNYRLVQDNLRVYSPTGDVHTSPSKRKLVARFEVCNTISPPRAKILELLKPDDPGRDALEEIVKPAPRRGFVKTLDEDSRMYLQRALLSPSPRMSEPVTPEPGYYALSPEPRHYTLTAKPRYHILSPEPRCCESTPEPRYNATAEDRKHLLSPPQQYASSLPEPQCLRVLPDRTSRLPRQKSLAEELHEAEHGRCTRWFDREECAPAQTTVVPSSETSRRLDALLTESRVLHAELADIHADIQAESARAVRCAASARALAAEARGLSFLDDVLALLRGDVAAATRAHRWPFVLATRDPDRNYVI